MPRIVALERRSTAIDGEQDVPNKHPGRADRGTRLHHAGANAVPKDELRKRNGDANLYGSVSDGRCRNDAVFALARHAAAASSRCSSASPSTSSTDVTG